MMSTLSSLVAITTTCGACGADKVGIITAVDFHYRDSFDLFLHILQGLFTGMGQSYDCPGLVK